MKKNLMIAAFAFAALGATAQTDIKNPAVPQKDTVPAALKVDTIKQVTEVKTVTDTALAQNKIISTENGQPVNAAIPEAPKTVLSPALTATTAAAPAVYSSGIVSAWDPLEKGTVVVFDGQAYVTANNRAKPVAADMTLSDGTVIMADGTIQKTNGKKIRLKNGQEYKYGQAKSVK